MKSANKKLREALLNRQVEVDKDEAWADIASALDQRKKFRFPIYLFYPILGIGLAIGMVSSERGTFSPMDENKVISAEATEGGELEIVKLDEVREASTHPKTELSKTEVLESDLIKDENPDQKSKIISHADLPAVHTQSDLIVESSVADNDAEASKLKQTEQFEVGNTSARVQQNGGYLSDLLTNDSSMKFQALEEEEKNPVEKDLLILENDLAPLGLERNFDLRPLSLLPVEPKKSRSYIPDVAFVYGTGFVPVSNSYSDLSRGEFAKMVPQRASFYGLELFFDLDNHWSIKTGIFDHTRRYKVAESGEGFYKRWLYNYGIPIMLNYDFRSDDLSPYIAFGADLNIWLSPEGTFNTYSSLTDVGYNSNTNPGSYFSPVLEIGAPFRILNQKFSLAAEMNIGVFKTIEARYGIYEGEELVTQLGESYSRGSYYALKLKYHLSPRGLLRRIKDGPRRKKSKSDKGTRKNEIGLEALGLGIYGSVYYQRFVINRSRFRLGLKQGFMYIPEFEEKGFVVGPEDDIKPMGFYIPSSVIAYLGPEKLSLQVGLGNTFLYGPLRYPVENGLKYGTTSAQFLITGVRGRVGRFSIQGQFNLGYSYESGVGGGIATNLGFGVGYEF